MNKIIKLLLVFLISNSVLSQDFKTVPDAFNKQCKSSFIKSIENGNKSLNDISKKTSTDLYWIVYSDRKNNDFYSEKNGSSNSKTASFLQGFFVQEVSGNWLHLIEMIEEVDMGWIKADKLILSNFSLITESDLSKGEISIPRKSIILTSIDNANSTANSNKKYYTHPSNKSKVYESGKPKKFQSLFVYKESNGSLLLGVTDVLGHSGTNKSSKIHGWINEKDVEAWNTRVALENSDSELARETYGSTKFNGYSTLKELELCLEQQSCSNKSNFVQIKIAPTRSNEMRRPIIETVDDNIFRIVAVLGDKDGSKEMESKLEKARKLQERINIVFVLDATASMNPYYKSIANSLEKVIDNNQKIINSSLKVGVVIYRDYLDGNDAYDVLPLSTNFKKTKEFINNTRCHSKDKDLPEAQYNGLINGLSKVGFNSSESNVVVIIGDCGNHVIDEKGYKSDQIVELFDNYNVNVISFQVDSKSDYSFFKFNEDIFNIIKNTAKKRVSSSTLKIKFKELKDYTIKLLMIEEGKEDYENMFGVIVYANGESSSPKLLEKTIESSITDYMKSIEKNINILSQYIYKGGPVGEKPPPGIINALMKKFKLTEEEVIDYLKKTELTAKAFVALDYNGSGVPTQKPVILLTEFEKNKLTKSLMKLTEGDYGTSERKAAFQKNIILVCRSIIGQSTSEELIKSLTMNQIWNIVLGVDFGNKKIKNLKLSELETEMSRAQFRKFYKEFENISRYFCNNSYIYSDQMKNRRFSVAGSYLYWIPLEDLPGCKVE
jgi:hypothetical protein